MTETEKVESYITRLQAVNKSIKKPKSNYISRKHRKMLLENSSKITAGQKWLAEQRVRQIVNKL